VIGGRPRAEVLLRGGDGTGFGAPLGFILFHGSLEESDLSAKWYARAIEQRDTRAPWILAHLLGDRLTSSQHWPALRKMMKLTVKEVMAFRAVWMSVAGRDSNTLRLGDCSNA